MDKPLCPLLIQHPMTTLLATNLVASLQRHSRVTFSTKVRDNRAIDRAGETISSTASSTAAAKGVLAAERGNLVCFAGHGGVSFQVLRKG